MKLLVFAHTPPPHHGQSYMVQLMLEGFGGNQRQARNRRPGPVGSRGSATVECYHVNARLSQNLEDIGDLRVGKFILLLWYCLQAIWCRFRYGVTNFYYIPAPGKPSALYRDWLVMFICRPFFHRVVLHWHAAGLAKWLERVVQMRSRSLTYRFMKQVDLSIVLSKYNQADAEKLFSKRIKVVSNGIPDPCPSFETEVLPQRRARFAARQELCRGTPKATTSPETETTPRTIKVLYLAHCTHEKGLFDTLEGVRIANEMLVRTQSPLSVQLMVAGTFVNADEKRQWESLMTQPDLARQTLWHGFVSGEEKNRLLREADLFCFPTYYQNENQPVNLIEAMAYGLPILTTKWRSIPELFSPGYTGLVEVRSPQQIAEALLRLAMVETGEEFRGIFLANFTLKKHLAALEQAFLSLETTSSQAYPDGVPASR
jgi:glycosyltransferase involved in cell wall biosynthesis